MYVVTCSTIIILCALALCPVEAKAQSDPLIGSCEPSTGGDFLSAGNVATRIPNNGSLFFGGFPIQYEIPRGSGVNAIYSANIWVGGLVDNNLRISAAIYGRQEFWAGPLDETGRPPADCSVYDRVWKIHRDDLNAYRLSGEISDNLNEWPWQLGAPVIDGDGDPQNYNLEGGDVPQLYGDETFWWVMNDRGNVHESTESGPIGLEVQALAFAHTHPGFVSNMTFYEYTLINKNTRPLEEAYFGLYMDADLGYFGDDYRGSDSLLHLAYVYNSDNMDEGNWGYGENPPAVGFTFLESALADTDGRDNDRDGAVDEPGETLGMSSAAFFDADDITSNFPVTAQDYYYYMQGRWKDGRRIIEGGYGIQGYPLPDDYPSTPTNFTYSGDPLTRAYWTEYDVDGQGTSNRPGNRFMLGSTGPFKLDPGQQLTIRMAVVWARGEDHLDSVSQLKSEVAEILANTDAFYEPTRYLSYPPEEKQDQHVLGFNQNYPNPFKQTTTLSYSLPKPMQVKLAVYDVLGREVARLVDQSQESGIYAVDFDAGSLPGGVYFARIELDHLQFTKRMVLLNR